MPSPEIARALLSTESQQTLSLPTAALILGALSQVESLIELAEAICNPVFGRSTAMIDSAQNGDGIRESTPESISS